MTAGHVYWALIEISLPDSPHELLRNANMIQNCFADYHVSLLLLLLLETKMFNM